MGAAEEMSIKTEMVTRTETYTATIYICDACGKEITWSHTRPWACKICGRHFHNQCDRSHSEYFGDYEEVTCSCCCEIGKPFREKIKELEREQDEALAEWHKIARAAASRNGARPILIGIDQATGKDCSVTTKFGRPPGVHDMKNAAEEKK